MSDSSTSRRLNGRFVDWRTWQHPHAFPFFLSRFWEPLDESPNGSARLWKFSIFSFSYNSAYKPAVSPELDRPDEWSCSHATRVGEPQFP